MNVTMLLCTFATIYAHHNQKNRSTKESTLECVPTSSKCLILQITGLSSRFNSGKFWWMTHISVFSGWNGTVNGPSQKCLDNRLDISTYLRVSRQSLNRTSSTMPWHIDKENMCCDECEKNLSHSSISITHALPNMCLCNTIWSRLKSVVAVRLA